jgi:hypothetical protein
MFQVSDCRYLQEVEIIFAGIGNTADVSIECDTPVIVFRETAVKQQVVPPSKCARAF